MANEDREHWNDRYSLSDPPREPVLPEHFRAFASRLAAADTAIDIACGAGRASVWLALQGVHVRGYDISPVAIAQATELARIHGVEERCSFDVADFDQGLPPGPRVDLVICNMFRSSSLDDPMIERLKPKGLIAIAALSEVGATPGRFRATAGELTDAFSRLDVLGDDERDGVAWLVAQRDER